MSNQEMLLGGGFSDVPPFSATGGTITTVGADTVHTFTGSGPFVLENPPPGFTVQYLVVAGGGGGGRSAGFAPYAKGGGGGGGGGSSSGGSVATPTTTNTFVFTITSNESGFTTSVNNVPVPTNKSVRISRESLATEDKLIKIAKKGYKCDEYYIVTMVDDDLPLIKNIKVSDTPLGISTKDIDPTLALND